MGWVYLPAVGRYYRAVFQLVDWYTARDICQQFDRRSRLVDVNDAYESEALQALIASFEGK